MFIGIMLCIYSKLKVCGNSFENLRKKWKNVAFEFVEFDTVWIL